MVIPKSLMEEVNSKYVPLTLYCEVDILVDDSEKCMAVHFDMIFATLHQ